MDLLEKNFQNVKVKAERAFGDFKDELESAINESTFSTTKSSPVFRNRKNNNSSNINNNRRDHNASYSSTISDSSYSTVTMSEVMHHKSQASSWEKALVAVQCIASEVFLSHQALRRKEDCNDDVGVEIVCLGGEHGINEHRNLEWFLRITPTDFQSTLANIAQDEPGGPCFLGAAMEKILARELRPTKDEMDPQFDPCSIVVLTTGKPDDSDLLEIVLRNATQTIIDRGGIEACPLSITFVAIGTSDDVKYWKRLAETLRKFYRANSKDANDHHVKSQPVVNAIDYQELKETLDAMKAYRENNKSLTIGAVLGAAAKAASGMNALYKMGRTKVVTQNNKMTNQQDCQRDYQRTSKWAGEWKYWYGEIEITTLTVHDDGKGHLTIIDGMHAPMMGEYEYLWDEKQQCNDVTQETDENGECNINETKSPVLRHTGPTGNVIEGTTNDDHTVVHWSDGTRWEATFDNKEKDHFHWTRYCAAAAKLGAHKLGDALQAKLGKTEQNCPYILVLDRSAHMAPRKKAPTRNAFVSY